MDKGPWKVGEFRKFNGAITHAVFSDDFDRDVMITVHGDFEDESAKTAYCDWLAARLNSAPDTASEKP